MRDATLCYLVVDGRVLLIDKKRGLGAGTVNGPGGKIEPGETPRECAVRETREEVGVDVLAPEKRGEVRFAFGDDDYDLVHVFRAAAYEGTPTETPEAAPAWYPLTDVPYDEMWADDRYWLPMVLTGETVQGWFRFDADGDELVERHVQVGVSFD